MAFSALVDFAGYGQDTARTWEAVLLGAIPIVNARNGLGPLFANSPVIALSNWQIGYSKEQLLAYQVPTLSRKSLMYQYWNDKIKCLRSSIQK